MSAGEVYYVIPDRDEIRRVLKNWDSDSYQKEKKDENIKVVVDYLDHLKDNIFNFGEMKEFSTDYHIVGEIKSKVDVDDREFQIASFKSSIQLNTAKKQYFKIIVAMLELLKSLMKGETLLEFNECLLALPEDCLKSKATTLEFCESLNKFALPEDQKAWLLKKIVENDINSAYDDASKLLETCRHWECFYISKLGEIPEAVPEHEEEEEVKLTDDLDSLTKCLKAVEGKTVKILEQGRQLSEDRGRQPKYIRHSIKYLDVFFKDKLGIK